jgi:hypothetical protein
VAARPADRLPRRPERGELEGYPGAKAGAGVYQTIINEFPPHQVYVEAFVGGGAILLRKRPATTSTIAIDADADVAARWCTIARSGAVPRLTAMHGDARSLIASFGERIRPDWLIYADPPYVRSTRRSRAPLYRHEFTDRDHKLLLSLLLTVPAAVVVSGYRCVLYDRMLAGWRRIDFRAMTRGGPAIESLWCNFTTAERHEYTYLGGDFRERERIKRKKTRWVRRIAAMPELERNALLEALLEHRRPRRGRPAPSSPAPLASFSDARSRIAVAGDPAGEVLIASNGEPAGAKPPWP